MGRKSTISRLPASVREQIGELRDAGHTIDEILTHIKAMGAPVSRSGLGRHVKQLDAIGKEIRRSREIAEALVKRYGQAPEGRTARLNIELMHAFINRLLVSEEGEVVQLEPGEVMAVSRGLKDLAQASRHDVAKEAETRMHFAKKAADTAAKTAEDEATKAGRPLPPEALKRIREQVYGIFTDER